MLNAHKFETFIFLLNLRISVQSAGKILQQFEREFIINIETRISPLKLRIFIQSRKNITRSQTLVKRALLLRNRCLNFLDRRYQ